MSLRLALFDLDGTLVDGLAPIVTAMQEAAAALAVPVPDEAAVRQRVGLVPLAFVADLYPEAEPALLAALARAFKDHFHVGRQAAPPEALFPGAVEALAAFEAAGWLLGIATGKSRRGVERLLAAHRLPVRFVTIGTADCGPGKPDPFLCRKALAETGAEAKAAVMIGDTSYDMAMARAAGLRRIGVGWGYHEPDALSAAGAEHVAGAMATLPALAARLIEARG